MSELYLEFTCTTKCFSSSLPWQHAEVTRVSLIFVVDDMPVSVVHLNALPNRSTHKAGLGLGQQICSDITT